MCESGDQIRPDVHLPRVAPSSLLFFAVTFTVDLSVSTLFLPLPQIAMHAADMGNSAWTLQVLDEGFRQTAADPHYSILPPVWDELKMNSKHLPPLRVGGQAGRPKGKRPTKRKASNGEYNTHSCSNAVRMKTPSSTGSTQRKSADLVVAIDGVQIRDAHFFCSRISLRGFSVFKMCPFLAKPLLELYIVYYYNIRANRLLQSVRHQTSYRL